MYYARINAVFCRFIWSSHNCANVNSEGTRLRGVPKLHIFLQKF